MRHKLEILIPKIKVLLLLVFAITGIKVLSQVTYPKSVAFQTFGQLSITPTTQVQSQPNIVYQQPNPGLSMGGNAQDIINQSNRQAMQMMGYQPPVIPPSDPALRDQFIRSQYQQNKQQQQLAELQALLKEDLQPIRQVTENDVDYLAKTSIYRNAFAQLLKMRTGETPFSLKKLVFLVENAYLDTSMKYAAYNKQIAAKVKLLKSIMKTERISSNNNLGKNYVIQKLFSERIVEYKDTVVWKVHKPFQYDFEDFKGETDWTKMFVTKLLNKGKGQCHSLPLLYLIFAEELNAKAWLSLAPEHSFVMFSDNGMKTFYNFETTNGNPVSPDWIMESGYINSNAIRSKIYLDTLGREGLIASCLADLIMGYTEKFGYDVFMASMVDTLLSIYPKSIQGQILKADLLAVKLNTSAKRKGLTSPQQFPQFQDINNLYLALQSQYEFIDDLGYAQMPKEQYEAWLFSLNDERKKADKQKLKTTLLGNVQKNN